MSGVVHDWGIELIGTYPDLFRPVGDPPRAEGWPCLADGWRDLLARCCARIHTAVKIDGGTFHFSQIKEKCTVSIYWSGTLSPEAAVQVGEAVDLTEARSAITCEVCGERGLLHGPAWFTTRCTQRAKGRPPIKAQPSDDIQVIERVMDGGRQELRRRKTAGRTPSLSSTLHSRSREG